MKKNVTLICSVCLGRNYKTNSSVIFKSRLVLNKYCKHCKIKTIHKQTK